MGRSPHGERGLKLIVQPCLACPMRGRSPHGERGLKLQMTNVLSDEALSLSSWRAWIEILRCCSTSVRRRSLSSWRAWIEIVLQLGFAMLLPSLSSWRAWIEISSTPSALLPTLRRSPHGERGLKSRGIGLILYDAFCRSPHGERGLKSRVGPNPTRWHRSLSSWRAWIEIGCTTRST